MKSLLAFLFVAISAAAQGAETKFYCDNVGGTEEWTIYVDLDKKIAGFFDNDTTVTVPLVKVVSLESHPPQTEYTFEGEDSYLGKGNKLRVVFNKTRLTGYVVFIDKKGKKEVMEAQGGCVADSSVDIDLE